MKKTRNLSSNSIFATTAPKPPEAAQFWEFKSAAGADEATLYVYGDIVTYDFGDWNYPDDVVPNKFKEELKALGNVKSINIRINSNGGSVFAAYAIMNLLKSHAARIIVHVDGIAASAATIIAMAGDEINTAIGSVWMIHLPSFMLWDNYNANDLNKMITALNSVTMSMVDVYAAKTGIDKAEIERMMSEETWLTGTQAVEKGFANKVTDVEAVAYLAADKKTAVFNGINVDISKIRSRDKLLAMIKEEPPAPKSAPVAAPAQPAAAAVAQAAEPPNNNKETEESIMNLEELKAKYPDLYATAVKDGAIKGAKDERKRIQGIDDMALPGMEALTNKAKYETGITAGEFAVELIKAQKKSGASFIAAAAEDAKALNDVPPGGAPPNNDEAEEQALLAHTGKRAESLR
ncbi:MAG: Clp protease ClpP [Clostridiales bacterium]|jgi:ATP-dependent protease ClpP protease subunit|nr:Clp protease ClpP [Clostridiales bacterium]